MPENCMGTGAFLGKKEAVSAATEWEGEIIAESSG
jgi:hypothetical protein